MALTEAQKERKRLWAENNRDKLKVSSKRYYEKNKAACLEGCHRRYKKRAESDPDFRETLRQKSRQYYSDMKDDPIFKVKRKQATISYRNANRESLYEKQRARHAKNKSNPDYVDQVRRVHRKSEHKCIKSLGDSYIKKRLCQGTTLTMIDIPQDMIELKRQQLILYRTIQEVRKAKINIENNKNSETGTPLKYGKSR